jgi:DNA gyrase subunit A
MKFRDSDYLLSMSVVRHGEDPDVFVVFENGLAKRTPASEYPVKGRATLGVRVAQISERGGDLVGALTVDEDDEVMVVMEKGKIVRSRVDEVHRTKRNTMGVQFAKPDKGDAIVAVARNAEKVGEAEVEELVAGDAETAKVMDGPAAATAGVDDAQGTGLVDTADIADDGGPGDDVADGAPEDGTPPDDVPSDETFDDNAGGSE